MLPKVQLTFFLAKAFKSSNVDLCHFVWVPSPQRLQKLIMLPPQSWKHPQVSMELLFNFFASFFPLLPSPCKIPVLAENITSYILQLWRILSVIANEILQIIIKTVTSSTFLEFFYRLCCCMVRLMDTCKFSILRDIFLFHNFKMFQTCDSLQREMVSNKLLPHLGFLLCFTRRCKTP